MKLLQRNMEGGKKLEKGTLFAEVVSLTAQEKGGAMASFVTIMSRQRTQVDRVIGEGYIPSELRGNHLIGN